MTPPKFVPWFQILIEDHKCDKWWDDHLRNGDWKIGIPPTGYLYRVTPVVEDVEGCNALMKDTLLIMAENNQLHDWTICPDWDRSTMHFLFGQHDTATIFVLLLSQHSELATIETQTYE